MDSDRNTACLLITLDERGRRRWAATEAISIGRGDIIAVATATGLSDRTVKNGTAEIQSKTPLPSGRQRRLGGGRKYLEQHQSKLVAATEALVEPSERGDPQSPLRWTNKSLGKHTLKTQQFSWRLELRDSTTQKQAKQVVYFKTPPNDNHTNKFTGQSSPDAMKNRNASRGIINQCKKM